MKFGIDSVKKTTWPVHVLTPKDGAHIHEKFEGIFIIPDQDFVRSMAVATQSGNTIEMTRLAMGAFTGWGDLFDNDGQKIEVHPKNKEALFKSPFILSGILGAIAEIIYGAQEIEEKEKEKN